MILAGAGNGVASASPATEVASLTTDAALAAQRNAQVVGTYCAGNGDTGRTVCISAVDDSNRSEKISAANAAAGVGQAQRANVVVAQLCTDINGAGSGYTMFSSVGCTMSNGIRASNQSLGSVGFNDQISSFYGYSSCTVTLWENDLYAGANVVGSAVGYVGASMNDKGSSVKVQF